ncbi:unnamed protein product [Didymodactylos carnosus]|uniref:Uncharacterized protein n=1 Tax=Didymodactylos carnosus TaxID=1234261 RepID=A0A815Q4V7_9BILA|nr:unnamed protein product [Didymodactylos carnosus]CAF4328983.1 unnamed protein product [Didymodactylos carnosus]
MYHWSGQRGWNFSNAYEHAMVKQYEERKSDFVKYKKQCIEDGKNGELTDDFVTNVRLKMLKTTDYGLICCCPTPRIGVFLKSKTTKPSLHHFYSFLSKMYEQAESQLKCWNNQYEQFGCHLWLFVSGQKQSAKVTEQIYRTDLDNDNQQQQNFSAIFHSPSSTSIILDHQKQWTCPLLDSGQASLHPTLEKSTKNSNSISTIDSNNYHDVSLRKTVAALSSRKTMNNNNNNTDLINTSTYLPYDSIDYQLDKALVDTNKGEYIAFESMRNNLPNK